MTIYKKTILAAFVISCGTISLSEYSAPAYSNVSGAPTGRSGSPLESNCSITCHTGSALTTPPGLITSNVPVTGYIPGTTYTVTATISVLGINKYGFEISPQNTAGGTLKGTLIVTNATETKLIGSGKYITHKSAGTVGTGTKIWSFNWTAPVIGSGDVTFYGAFVGANGNGLNSGDKVYLSSMLVQQNPSAGINEITHIDDRWTVYPNPASDRLYFRTLEPVNTKADVTITDITGRLIKSLNDYELSQTQYLDISELQSGIYLLNIASEKGVANKKFVKN